MQWDHCDMDREKRQPEKKKTRENWTIKCKVDSGPDQQLLWKSKKRGRKAAPVMLKNTTGPQPPLCRGKSPAANTLKNIFSRQRSVSLTRRVKANTSAPLFRKETMRKTRKFNKNSNDNDQHYPLKQPQTTVLHFSG